MNQLIVRTETNHFDSAFDCLMNGHNWKTNKNNQGIYPLKN
jgi:hypothetical protein